MALAYTPTTKFLVGTTGITAVATENLKTFSLDLEGMTVTSVHVDGPEATVARSPQKLVVTPATPLISGRTFHVDVTFRGQPGLGSTPGSQFVSGWVPTTDGAVVLAEPDGAHRWFPSNDTVGDKATLDLAVSVPSGLTAIGNGRLISRQTTGDTTTWHWRAREPMVPYAASVAIGKYTLKKSTIRKGLANYVAVDQALSPKERTTAAMEFSLIPAAVRYEEKWFGPYPFDTIGGIAASGGLAQPLETQTKPTYYRGSVGGQAHELGHQWFGDSLSIKRWHDIWLNEGFATFARQIWLGRASKRAVELYLASEFRLAYESGDWGTGPIAHPPLSTLFSARTYDGGAAALAGLYFLIGDTKFKSTLHAWTRRYRNGNVTTKQFIALVRASEGRVASSYLNRFLFATTKPKLPAVLVARIRKILKSEGAKDPFHPAL